MRKLTKKNLDELAEMIPRISEIEKRSIVGGGTGTKDDPYTVDEFDSMCDNNIWKGGWVDDLGYVAEEVTVVASGTSDSGNSSSGNWDGLFPDLNITPSGYWNTPDSSGNLISGDFSGGIWSGGVWIPNFDSSQTGNETIGGGSTSGGGISGGSGNQDSNSKYSETWQKNKSIIYQIAVLLGVDLNVMQIELGTGRSAYAWRNGNKIIIGDHFFEDLLNNNDKTSVLIHELQHLIYDDNSEVKEDGKAQGRLADGWNSLPDFVKDYMKMDREKDGIVTNIDIKDDFWSYVDYTALKSPVYYENELKAYRKEIEHCSDSFVSEEYALERKYKIWKFEILLEKSKEIFNK